MERIQQHFQLWFGYNKKRGFFIVEDFEMNEVNTKCSVENAMRTRRFYKRNHPNEYTVKTV